MPNLDPPRTPDIPPDILPLRARQWRVPKSLSALQHPNFRLYVAGQLVSLMGTWMQNIGQGWLVYQLSHSELALGIVGFASAIPALAITPWGGVLVDRANKRNLLAWTQVGAMLLAFILAGLTFAEVVQVWHVVALAVGLGVVNAFDGPARQAFVVEMVGREDLSNAIALNSITFNAARIVGPAIGGLLLVIFGAGWCFLFNGLSFLAVIASLWTMRLPAYRAKPAQLSPWQQLKIGVVYASRTPELRALLLLALVFSLFGISYATIMPAFVDKALHRDGTAYGVVNAMSGVGAVAGAFLVARYGDSGFRGKWLAWASLTFPVTLTLFSLNRSYPLALLLAMLLGVGFMTTYTLINTLLQTQLADEMRGRVLSLYTLTFFGFTPFGNLAIGTLAESWGIRQAMILSAGCSLVFTALVFWRMPVVRRLA